jgi:hypothetical protein
MGGMTRMHFRAIARVFHNEYNRKHDRADGTADVGYESGYESALWRMSSRLATVFEGFNPNFDREKFIDACTQNEEGLE